ILLVRDLLRSAWIQNDPHRHALRLLLGFTRSEMINERCVLLKGALDALARSETRTGRKRTVSDLPQTHGVEERMEALRAMRSAFPEPRPNIEGTPPRI